MKRRCPRQGRGVSFNVIIHPGEGWGEIAWVREFVAVVLVNTLIALVLATAVVGGPPEYSWWMMFTVDWGMSQAIGFSIWGIAVIGRLLWPRAGAGGQLGVAMAAIVGGAMGGSWLGGALVLGKNWFDQPWGGQAWQQAVILGLMFGVLVTLFFSSRAKIAEERAKTQAAEMIRIDKERSLAEAHLKLLQAQIEPHFLFNTLANIAGLIEPDAPAARRMLGDLNRYLRVSLDRTRAPVTTLGQELEMVRAYLDIMKIRMGDRLDYRLHVPSQLHTLPFPPLLLQPLVENAIRHGLEPKVEGGGVLVRGEVIDSRLRLQVWDDGVGLEGAEERGTPGHGVGLANVRMRLESMWGEQGSLRIEGNPEGGVCATLEVPCDADDCDPGR